MKRINPATFNRRVAFGDIKTVTNPHTGGKTKEFVADFSVWFAERKRTLDQQYELVGTSLEDTKLIIVRHKKEIADKQVVSIDGVTYDIQEYSPDDSFGVMAYDYVTLKRRS